MIDYNDGNWHGWNGGECPVHPQTVVEVVVDDTSWIEGTLYKEKQPATYWCWNDEDAPVVAFRVIKEYREPRKFWILPYYDKMFRTEAEALAYAKYQDHKETEIVEAVEKTQ